MIINVILSLIVLINLVIFYWLIKDQKISKEILRLQEKRLRHALILMDMIADSGDRPLNFLYRQVRCMDPDTIPFDRKEIMLIFKDSILKKFIESRDEIYKISQLMEDPKDKKKQEASLLELETVITLLSSLDKNASIEYIEDVLKNMVVSLDKIVGIQNDN